MNEKEGIIKNKEYSNNNNFYVINDENLSLRSKKYNNSDEVIHIFNKNKITIFIIICLFELFLIYLKNKFNSLNSKLLAEKIIFDKYEVEKYNEIKDKFNGNNCSQMTSQERKFINGVVRKYKPKKILEVGVYHGGSSSVILNAISDIPESKLYSIDLDIGEHIGYCVNKYFPNFIKNWRLFKGNITTEFIEEIGNNIEMLIIDTAHFEPGEILDFLIVLPFLKDEAIVIFHDIAVQIFSHTREEWAPYIIFNGIRGTKYLPSGNHILKHNIGAVKLEKNQYKYFLDYFRLLGGEWQYFPKENHIYMIQNYFRKYYDNDCLIIFDEATTFNRNFVKRNPKLLLYNLTSD